GLLPSKLALSDEQQRELDFNELSPDGRRIGSQEPLACLPSRRPPPRLLIDRRMQRLFASYAHQFDRKPSAFGGIDGRAFQTLFAAARRQLVQPPLAQPLDEPLVARPIVPERRAACRQQHEQQRRSTARRPYNSHALVSGVHGPSLAAWLLA